MARPTYTPSSIPTGTAAWDADWNQSTEADLVDFLLGGPLPLYRQSVGLADAEDFELCTYFNKQTSGVAVLSFSNLAPANANDWVFIQRAKLHRNNRTTSGAVGVPGSLNTNEGAGGSVSFTMPAGINERQEGTHFYFINFNAAGLVIDMASSNVLRRGTDVTSAGGTASTTEIGAAAMVTLSFKDGTAAIWFMEEFQGTWVFA